MNTRYKLYVSIFLSLALLSSVVLLRHRLSALVGHVFKKRVEVAELRGRILDRKGRVLADSVKVWSCGVSKKRVRYADRKKPAQPESVVNKEFISSLAEDLNVPQNVIEEQWSKSENFFYAAKAIDADVLKRLKMNTIKKFEGVSIEEEQRRRYPNGLPIRDLLGAVYDNRGISGLEQVYDAYLRPSRESAATKAKDASSDVYLTLDRDIQSVCEQSLSEAVRANKALSGFVIVQEPATGDLLALASYPAGAQNIPAIGHVHEPGALIKIVTVAAALEEKAISKADKVNCENGEWKYASGVTIHDDKQNGMLTVSEVMGYPSHIGAAKIALKTGAEKFYSYLKAFGFGVKTGLDYPGESNGLIRSFEQWKPISLVTAAYGYGIAVTGLQLVAAYSAIANGGILKKPRLVSKVARRDATILLEKKPLDVRRVVSENTAKDMVEMLKQAVERGTSLRAKEDSYGVAGLASSTRKIDEMNGSYSQTKFIGSFCGFVPADKPTYTILVVINEPKAAAHGDQLAASLFAKIAQRLLVYGK